MPRGSVLTHFCTLAACRLSLYLRERGERELLERYDDVVDCDAAPADLERALRGASELPPVWQELSETGRCLLELCVAARCLPRLEELLSLLQNRREPGVTLAFARNVAEGETEAPWKRLLLPQGLYESVERLLVPSAGPQPRALIPMVADERLLDFLCGGSLPDPWLRRIARNLPPGEGLHPALMLEECIRRVERGLAEEAALIQLTGAKGSGRRFAVRHAAARAGRGVLLVDYRALLASGPDHYAALIQRLRREALFTGSLLCLHSVEEAGDREETPEDAARRLLRLADELLTGQGSPLCVCTQQELALTPYTPRSVRRVTLPAYGRRERIALWELMGDRHRLSARPDAVEVAGKFRLQPGEIDKAAARLRCLEDEGEAPDSRQVTRICYEVLPPPSVGSLTRIQTAYTMEDLKLPQEQKQILIRLCAHVQHRHLVYDQWGMEEKYPYGKGVSALFTGPPGTGKTMAAHVLSNLLDMDLYRVDLSQVVDKYIGETEKKLEEIFAAAEKSSFILLFDEADALFGKRSEVKDSKDKYANTETSYILQRIEDYDGIAILATNYKYNIDDAFLRRIRYLVDFQLPTPPIREEIWRSTLTQSIPLAPDLDFPYLAEQFEFSGGHIKNALLSAVFQAAQQGEPLCMRHILESVRMEMLKNGKTMLKQDFGKWSHVLR